ncbi:WD40 repeat-like protein [Auricularia subglabra TFB-10046 SS5]|nr:WD40 repeat-like protein [Auricularia subglabra TFB-10046 SS5]
MLGQQQAQQPLPPPPPLANADNLNLSNVLHFLQTEWRRYERDRNEWEIERAEMRARIALLEGERRSFENVKLDLMRRIKMLEHALRIERNKQLQPAQQQQPSQGVAQAKAAGPPGQPGASPQQPEGAGGKEDVASNSPRSEDSPLPADPRLPLAALPPLSNGSIPQKVQAWNTGPQNWGALNGNAAAILAQKPPPGRDPKSRARSREYLKQCLQEVTYLTSPQAMNPLPNRPLLTNPSIGVSLPNLPNFDQHAFNGRPRKSVPDIPPNGPQPPSQGPSLDRGGAPLQSTQILPPHEDQTHKEDEGDESQKLTAIYRPDDDWRAQFVRGSKFTGAPQQQSQPGGPPGAAQWDSRSADDQHEEGTISKDDDDDNEVEVGSLASEGENGQVWRARRTLRNHLDAVRALAFHPTEMCLATGGDDFTIKIWRMDPAGLASSNARNTTEIEPQLTMRGHSAPVTKLLHSPSRHLLYSASLDATIRVWNVPNPAHTTYAPYDHSRQKAILEGHTDAVWDLALVRDETLLVSCGADGSVKVWDVSGPNPTLKLTWGYHGAGAEESDKNREVVGATALEAIKTDLRTLAVAFRDGVIKLFDLDTGKELDQLQNHLNNDGGSTSQINKLVSHPTMPLLVSGHEDRYIRIFDVTTRQCTHSMPAHSEAVTSLSIDPAGFLLVSGGHDCSVRFWDLFNTRACVYETPSHREKGHEGVLAVEFHPKLMFLASAGADGVVKLYSQ